MVGWVVGVIAVLVAIAGVYRIDYYSISPGDALNVPDRITIEGRRSYPPDGKLMLLFVRERARVSLLQALQAWLDPDVDLVKAELIAGDQSPEELRAAAVAEMGSAQANAKLVALDRIGERVTTRPGARVLSVIEGRPADDVLKPDDVIQRFGDTPIRRPADLGPAIGRYDGGDRVPVVFSREGRSITKTVTLRDGPVDTDGDGTADAQRPQLGVYTLADYRYPFDIDIDTSDIGGPSAGLAMTLAIIDDLTPGNLTGGASVAVTGTIDPTGKVGAVGGIAQKAVAARVRGATLLLVPSCAIDSDQAAARAAEQACETELDTARERADGVEVVEVADLDAALRALRDHGGDAIPSPAA